MKKLQYLKENKQADKWRKYTNSFMESQQDMNLVGQTGSQHVRNLTGAHQIADRVQGDVFRLTGLMKEIFPDKSRPPSADDLLDKKQKYTPEQLREIKQGIEAFFNPDETILDYLFERKAVTTRQLRIINKAHKDKMSKIQKEILIGMTSGQMELSEKQKLRLTHLFNIPMKSSLTASAQIAVDAIWRQANTRRQNLMRRGMSLQKVADARHNLQAREDQIRGRG